MTSPPGPSPEISDPAPTTKPFRFKSKRPHSASADDPSPSTKRHKSSHRHHHHRHHSSRHRPRHDLSDLPNPHHPTLDPDTAFRESLFDALADDEGAAFWESVYGQPIHTYSAYHSASPTSRSLKSENVLERMTDEEYTAHVRAKMWEKSHGYILEERAKREEERARKKEWEQEKERRRRDRQAWESRIDEVLGKRQVRSKKNEWKGVWQRYLRRWEEIREWSREGEGREGKDERPKGLIPYPVKSLRLEDVSKEAVELFMQNAPQEDEATGEVGLLVILKSERVKWHPDKIQQRFGSLGLDRGTIKAVTAIFQVIDRLWVEIREKTR